MMAFPSPFGVRVLKFLHCAGHMGGRGLSFRPLSGFVFRNSDTARQTGGFHNGFRPLSGFVF